MATSTGHNVTAGDLVYRVDQGLGTTGNIAGVNKLWLPLWSGEVINAYDQYNVFESILTNRTLSQGFSYEFPITGTVDLTPSWNAGVELIGGQDAASTTFKVNLDKRPMAAHFECDNVDLLVTQWDYRSELARQAGLTLSNTRDKQLAMALVAASAVSSMASDPRAISSAFQTPICVSTSVIATSCTDTQALLVLAGVEDYLVKCQENDIAVEGTCLAVTPKVFQSIRALGIPREDTAFANNPMFTGGGAYGGNGTTIDQGLNSMPESLSYMGVKIIKTNHFGKIDHSVTANSLGSSKYNLNTGVTANTNVGVVAGYTSAFSIYGVIFQAPAIASLSLMGMKVDTVQDVRRNTQFTVASMLKGTGVVRPELCRAIVSGSAGNTSLDNAANTRVRLSDHLNGCTANTDTDVSNLASGFAAEYAVTAAS